MDRILIIGAHYDDAELGVGGTAAKLASEGREVYKLTLTNNVTRSKHLHLDIAYEPSVRESANACKTLGIQEVTDFEPVECNELFYNTKDMQRIEEVIYSKKIDTVFMHYMEDMNQDHVEAAKLCKTASRHCKNVFMYKSNMYVLTMPYYPSVFVDITDFVKMKKEALGQYEEQHNRYNTLFETTIHLNHVWGQSQKVGYAEAFVPIRMML